ncbi:MAG: ribonuclease Y [Gemmatimonadetes bacterium]|nr:ribonuclease Y [Gemmatimonadota bacterium]
MEIILTAVLTALVVGAIAGGIVYLRDALAGRSRKAAAEAAEQQVRRAEERSKEILLEAKEQALAVRTAVESDLRAERQELQRQEKRLEQRDEELTERAASLERHEAELRQLQSGLEERQEELKAFRLRELERLESVSGMSLAEARQSLLERAEEDIRFEVARRYRDAEIEAQEQADARAREVVSQAIQRLASDVASESTVSTIPLPNDEMKGRLIGREGRNIRAIENATGVDLIIDDVPEAVTISCFDPVRREIARISLERLIKDGRIHPARVEDVVARASTEVEETVRKAGEQALFDANVRGVHPDLVRLMGRLKYRQSYGQNVLVHSVEVSRLSAMMAAEAGADVELCKVAGFLHDVGKALTHEVEGPHAQIGADIVAKYGLARGAELAIREHHDREMSTAESFIVSAADAVSSARPGARRDTIEAYLQRLEALEEVARGFEGVERCFAIQAGREVRVMVIPDTIDDVAAASMAREIAKRVEETVAYPGQIKVVVIRESRAVEYAR